MKTKQDPEQENEKLDDVTFEQAKQLKELGFDWNCGQAYDESGNDVNWTTKDFFCWKPTVQLALRFIRKRYGIYHDTYTRSWDENVFGYSISHSHIHLDFINCSLLEDGDEEEDGIVSFDYDESQSIALDYAIRYLMKDLKDDFSWIKPRKNAFFYNYQLNKVSILKVNEKMRIVKIRCEDDEFWTSFHKLTPFTKSIKVFNKV